MPELTRTTENQILHDIRQDSSLVQQMVDRLLMNTGATTLDYKDLDMLHYIVRTIDSRVRILRGYDR